MCVGFTLCSFALLTEFCLFFDRGEEEESKKRKKERKKEIKKAPVDPGTSFMIRMHLRLFLPSDYYYNKHCNILTIRLS